MDGREQKIESDGKETEGGIVTLEIQTDRLQLAIDMEISRTLSESSGAETTKSDSKEGVEQGKKDNYNSYPRNGGGGEEASTKVWGKEKIIGHSRTQRKPY